MVNEQTVCVITGACGYLGSQLVLAFPEGIFMDKAVLSPAVYGVDIAVKTEVDAFFEKIAAAHPGRPLVVLHSAAVTDTKSHDEKTFTKINVAGTKNVADATARRDGFLIHISTDYVFEAERLKDGSFTETDRPRQCPDKPYSRSKYEAEKIVLDGPSKRGAAVARIAYTYGGAGTKGGLVGRIIRRFNEARQNKCPVELFDDQTICPSFMPDVVAGLKSLVNLWRPGADPGRRIFHLTGEPVTPYRFGRLVRDVFQYDDVELSPSSVRGTDYAPSLWLSNERTAHDLTWKPTPHAEALKQIKMEMHPPKDSVLT